MDAVIQNRALRNRSVGAMMASALTAGLMSLALAISPSSPTFSVSALVCILCSASNFGWFFRDYWTARQASRELPSKTRFELVEDRLDELERLKRRDMVTQEEYAAKRQEILKDL